MFAMGDEKECAVCKGKGKIELLDSSCPFCNGTGEFTKILYSNGTNIIDVGAGFSLTSPNLVTGINDVAGNELFKATATASAINEFTIANAAAGNGPILSTTVGLTSMDGTYTVSASQASASKYSVSVEISSSDASASVTTIAARDRKSTRLNSSHT